MITLYHSPFSVSSQKVRMVLAEKNLSWEDKIIDLLSGTHLGEPFRQLNYRAEVPVIEHEGSRFVDSTLINEYLEERFPEVSLLPPNPIDRYQVRLWSNWIDRSLHTAAGIITYAILARPLILKQPHEQIERLLQKLPDPSIRLWRQSVLEHGLNAPVVGGAITQYGDFFNRLESCLPNAYSWLAGDIFSLADITVLPYVMRADHLGLSNFMSFETYPNTRSWYMRMQSRPSMQPAFVKYVDGDTQELLMQLVLAAQPEIQKMMQQTTVI